MTLVVVMTHWALSLRQLESTFTGRYVDSHVHDTHSNATFFCSSLGISLSDEDLWDAVNDADAIVNSTFTNNDLVAYSYILYGEAWQYLLPLMVETVLFG